MKSERNARLRSPTRKVAAIAALGGASIAGLAVVRHRAARLGGSSLRLERGLTALRLAARGGARYASNAPRLFASAGEHLEALRNDLALQTAEDVAACCHRSLSCPEG